jgi:hypothetical protein
MNANQSSLWTRIWKCACSFLAGTRPSKTRYADHQFSPPMPAATGLERLGLNDKEFVARVQSSIGLSPTQGHELIQGLQLIQCRSPGVGAPQPTTGIHRHPIQISLARTDEERPEVSPIEEIRELARSAVRVRD